MARIVSPSDKLGRNPVDNAVNTVKKNVINPNQPKEVIKENPVVVKTQPVFIPGTGYVEKPMQDIQVDPNNLLQQQLAEEKQRASMAALDYAKQQALSGISSQKAELPKQTLASVGQARASSDISARNLKEYMSQRFGTSVSGAEGQGMVNIQTQRQGAESQANLTEQKAMADLGAQESAVNSKYALDVANVQSGIQSDLLRSELERQQELARQAREDKVRNDAYTREDTLRTQEQNRADFAATINKQEDLTQKINDLTAQGVPESDYRITELKKARVQKLAQMAQAEYEAELAKEKDQAKREEQAFEIAKWKFEQGMPADAITSTLLGIPVGSKIPSQQIKEAELAIQQRKAASSGSSSSGNKLTYNQALTQARQILGDGRSPNEYTNLALQLQSGTASSTTKTSPSVKTPDTNKASDALEYLDKLEAARDLVSINAFVQNNQNEIDRIVNDPYATEAEIEAAQAIQRKYYKYR